MDEPLEEAAATLPAARFGDRLNAFALDGCLFSSSYLLTAWAVPGHYGAWVAFWAAAFLAYHAWFGAAGRQTLGKRLLGISARASDGAELTLVSSAARALGYLLSSLALNLGFLWALRKDGRAWHDMIADSRVVETSPKSGAIRTLSTAASWLTAGAMVAGWFFLVVIGPGLTRMKLLAQANIGLKSLAVLEDEHKAATGAYTADFAELLGANSENAAEVRRALRFHLNQDSVTLAVGGDSYAIEADALDSKGTRLRLEGPGEITPP
jgi:uncharacterized RDD family membrane protein YckC